MIYNSTLKDEATGAIDFDSDTIYVMLVSGYTPNQKTHKHRSDVTGEVTGTGYTAGGQAVTVGVTEDDTNNRVDISLGGATWNPATISATAAVYYKHRGGAASADELIYCNEFGTTVASTNGSFTLAASTIRKQA